MSSAIPDLLSIIPEGDPKRLICHCLNELGLSLEETERLLQASLHIVSSVEWLLYGGHYRSTNDPLEP